MSTSFERKFSNLLQSDTQTIEQYLTELKTQAKLCSFICEKEKLQNQPRRTYDRGYINPRHK